VRPTRSILLIEDDVIDQMAFKRFLDAEHGELRYTVAGSLAEARKVLDSEVFDVVVTDYLLGDGTALDVLGLNLESPVIIITGAGSEEVAVQAMKAGAHDYLIKDPDRRYLKILPVAVEKAVRQRGAEDRIRTLSEQASEQVTIAGSQAGLSEALRLVELAASSDMPVLISGETGTGKSLIAKAIHYRGAARGEPFINVNCACLPETLIEAELFGYERGAFTGAVNLKRGLFEATGGGTILLDEIGEMPMHLQARLLSVIEERTTRRLGGTSQRPFNGRIIASTNVDIEASLGKTFRKDLYYRLSVIRIHLPPLRERRQDIPELCRYLLGRLTGNRDARISEEELRKLGAYDWPGNVRELKNVLERAVLLHKGGNPRPSEFLGKMGRRSGSRVEWNPVSPDGSLMPLGEIERRYIALALDRFSGNLPRTAEALGISLSTLKRRVRELRSK
jgi:DNA-binding NtrC family response regulator